MYFRYLTTLLDTMRINFVNESKYTLTDIRITGCQKKFVDEIPPNGHELVWINISRPCPINLTYNENGVMKTEVVTQYVNVSEGQKLTFKIGDSK
jgi:hypothetical protein